MPTAMRERADARRKERLRKMRAKSGNRYRVHYDIDGPRVRLGMLWFVGAMAAFMVDELAVTVYFGLAFAIAASHTVRTWRARGAKLDPRVGMACTAFAVAAASFGPQIAGAVLIFGVALVLAGAAGELRQGEASSEIFRRSSLLLQAYVPTAVAGICLVLLTELDLWSAISLVLLTSAYETGDYLIGSGAANAIEGPAAGTAAVFVLTLAIVAVGILPFEVGESIFLGILVAPLAVLGQLTASVMLPHSRAFAPALRRVDSLLLVTPAWYACIDLFLV